jgi:hypothetical protein
MHLSDSFRFKAADIGRFNTKNSDAAVRNLANDVRIIGLTNGAFSLIDLVHSVLKKTGPAHVICTTWSAGIKDAHQVKWMQDTDLIRSFTLITDHSYVTRQSKYAVALDQLFGKENIRTGEVHAKFTLIHNDLWRITIRTSMNLNANKTCEHFEIDTCPDIFDFFKSFVDHTFGTMPEGFERSSWKASRSLDAFFNKQNDNLKGWSEI